MTAPMKARPTTYRGVQMRSRLEAGFAQWLDEMGFEWEYEPECFADERGQYLPDFRIHNLSVSWPNATAAYIEVKPANFAADWDLADRMTVIWASDPNAVMLIAKPHQDPRERLQLVVRVDGEPPEPAGVPFSVVWVHGIQGRPPSVAFPLQEHRHPWTGEYWNVKR